MATKTTDKESKSSTEKLIKEIHRSTVKAFRAQFRGVRDTLFFIFRLKTIFSINIHQPTFRIDPFFYSDPPSP